LGIRAIVSDRKKKKSHVSGGGRRDIVGEVCFAKKQLPSGTGGIGNIGHAYGCTWRGGVEGAEKHVVFGVGEEGTIITWGGLTD